MNKTYLFTGGTGFLGSLLATNLIENGDRVVFIGRSKDGKFFRDRLKEKLNLKEDSLFDSVVTLEVDLQEENPTLPKNNLDKLGKIDGIWHLAANLSFNPKNKDKVFSTNINGLKYILDFADYLKCPIYHVSTAYVHGKRSGVIFEDELLKPSHFNNYYEESKFYAEKNIKKWGEREDNNYIIFRPSILIGTQGKSLSFFGYYVIVYSLYKIKQKFKNKTLTIPLPFLYSRKTFLNLMPVDVAIDWMLKISVSPKALKKTFHITNPFPFPIQEVAKQTFDALNIRIPILRVPRPFLKLYLSIFYFFGFVFPFMRDIARKFNYYKYYITEYNIYDMKNTEDVLGSEIKIMSQLLTGPNFVKKVAEDFIKKYESLHN